MRTLHPNSSYACIGSAAIFRLSFCLLCLFFLMLLFMLPRARLSMIINEGCFFVKYMFVLGLFIGTLWISNEVFNTYSKAAQVISIFYMVIQSIIIIDLFYLAGIRMVRRYDEGQTRFAGYLIALSILVEALAVTLNVLGYAFFSDSPDGCSGTLWVNIITTILLIILPAVQFLHFNPQNSLLTTALVSLFISYLCFIAQYSYNGNPTNPKQCNRMETAPLIADIVCSTFFFILTMYGSIMGGTGEVKMAPNNVSLNEALGVTTDRNDPQEAQAAGKTEESVNEEKYTESFDWVKWHFYMCLASVYVSMLITNWASAGANSTVNFNLQPNEFGFWVRVSIAWATCLLYVWTMLAPRIFPNRDFTVE